MSPDVEAAGLSEKTRLWLLRWARENIQAIVEGGAAPPPVDMPSGSELPRGCFVSLHQSGHRLRGCIGTFAVEDPLWRNVGEMAVAAASRDPRFPALKAEELQACTIEISVLTPSKQARPDEVVVGRHGITVSRGASRGVLLPQVATDNGWDTETFISQTCKKAGLSGDAWRDGSVHIEVFAAQVFSDA